MGSARAKKPPGVRKKLACTIQYTLRFFRNRIDFFARAEPMLFMSSDPNDLSLSFFENTALHPKIIHKKKYPESVAYRL